MIFTPPHLPPASCVGLLPGCFPGCFPGCWVKGASKPFSAMKRIEKTAGYERKVGDDSLTIRFSPITPPADPVATP